MKKLRDVFKGVAGVLLLAGLAVALAVVLGRASDSLDRGQSVSPIDTPPPEATPQVGPTPTAPSEDWPTLTPEPTPPPPPTTGVKPKPTVQATPIQSFPTPAFSPTPVGEQPTDLQTIWSSYFPDPDSQPQLQATLVDPEGQRWGVSGRHIDLVLPKRQPGPDPGAILLGLHVSPTSYWMVADFAYVGSQLVDLFSGTSRSLAENCTVTSWHFLNWHPNGRQLLASTSKGIQLVDPVSQECEAIDFRSESGDLLPVRGVAYSPDGGRLADILVYSPTISKPDFEIEVGIRVGEQGLRTTLLRIPHGDMIAEHSLCWSPDGHKLIFVADIHEDGRRTQLWMVDVVNDTSRVLMQLASDIQYNHPAVWSPDGRYIAALRIEPDNHSEVYLIDPETGQGRQIAQFNEQQISHLVWSPDGRRLGFALATKDYGEIWITSLDGTIRYPVAGPTVPDSPFVWLPATEEGKK